jgi:hypothetical protein
MASEWIRQAGARASAQACLDGWKRLEAAGSSECVRVPFRWESGSAELLGKPDDEAFRPSKAGETVRLLVLHPADEFCAVGLHLRHDRIDAVDGKQ